MGKLPVPAVDKFPIMDLKRFSMKAPKPPLASPSAPERTPDPVQAGPATIESTGVATLDAPPEEAGQGFAGPTPAAPWADDIYIPPMPETFEDAHLPEALIESLICKYLFAVGQDTGRGIGAALGLAPKPIIELLQTLKSQQIVVYKGSGSVGDFTYTLTEIGRERAKKYLQESNYFGTAPVALEDYIEAIHIQTISQESPKRKDLERAFSDLLIDEHMFRVLGPAVTSGKGMFLYGFPGNGKTSIAERITMAFKSAIWMPKTIIVDGEIIKLYDPESHVVLDMPRPDSVRKGDQFDPRWVRIRRPTIMAGGELTMESLEIKHNPVTKISEAPLQLKANGGTFVIDDFGRQRMNVAELLNRWIVPLEKRYDFLSLSNGKKIKVPFDQLIIFSTNLEPRDLVDEAFLRRIPYKINIIDPTEEQFRELFRIFCPTLGMEHNEEAIDYLINTYYKPANRPFRACQPRDLLLQIHNICVFHERPVEIKAEYFDQAVGIYFAVM
jgi:hypothetical protein